METARYVKTKTYSGGLLVGLVTPGRQPGEFRVGPDSIGGSQTRYFYHQSEFERLSQDAEVRPLEELQWEGEAVHCDWPEGYTGFIEPEALTPSMVGHLWCGGQVLAHVFLVPRSWNGEPTQVRWAYISRRDQDTGNAGQLWVAIPG